MRGASRPTAKRPARGPSSEVGERILEASRHLLSRGGLEALTISAVEEEAGVYSSAIHYHFGSKEGLKAALVENLLDESRRQAEQAMRSLPLGRARLNEAVGRFEMMGGREVQLAFFETLGTQLRDDDLHRRVAELYELGKDLFVEVLVGAADPMLAQSLRPLAQLVFAFLDGMNVQLLIDPSIDDAPVLALMEDMVAAKTREITGVSLNSFDEAE